ncbi:MAG: hypothetical protein JJT89_01070 [Nitriliruptoraceae bacterium]|nr:hypothetical protein [Nitriliruptoraceae bacterium]
MSWTLDQANRERQDELHFVSRDGEVLLQVARLLQPTTEFTGALRYLPGGRTVWQRASILDEGDASELNRFIERCVDGYETVDVVGLAHRFGLEVGEMDRLAGRSGSPSMDVLDAAARRSVKDELTSPEGHELLRHAGQRARIEVDAFLAQEGLLEPARRIGYVDVGWSGGTVAALNRVRTRHGCAALSPWFLGYTGRGRVDPDVRRSARAYLWDARRGRSHGAPLGGTAVVEALCSGTHGPVLGYRKQGGVWAPHLAGERSAAARAWPLQDLRAGIEQYVVDLVEAADRLVEWPDPTEVRQTFDGFIRTPEPWEARLLGAIPFEHDAQGRSVSPLAMPFTVRDLPSLVRPGPPAARNLLWPTAAWTHSQGLTRTIVGMHPRVRAARGGRG